MACNMEKKRRVSDHMFELHCVFESAAEDDLLQRAPQQAHYLLI